jgi:predicted HTH domain antitoxin
MQITLNVPDAYGIDHEPDELGRHIKLMAALRMFQSGETSAGGAAEFADVDRFTFAMECQRHGVTLIDYPPEDLESEIEAIRRPSR